MIGGGQLDWGGEESRVTRQKTVLGEAWAALWGQGGPGGEFYGLCGQNDSFSFPKRCSEKGGTTLETGKPAEEGT